MKILKEFVKDTGHLQNLKRKNHLKLDHLKQILI